MGKVHAHARPFRHGFAKEWAAVLNALAVSDGLRGEREAVADRLLVRRVHVISLPYVE